jgi:multimeric flavodoxin WrbA
VLTFDAERLADYWLIADYLPEVAADNRRRFPSIEAVCEQLGGARVEVVPIPLDCSDGFFEAFFGRPEAILDPRLRAAQSGWGRLPREVAERAISKLEEDLKSGRWDERHASLRQAPAYDAGLRLIVASETTTRPHRPPRAASRTSVASSAPEPAPASERRQRPGGDPQVSVVVVFDSGSQGRPDLSGRTEVVAKEIVAGASNVPNTAVTLVSVADPEYPWELLDAADAIVFGCPTYMGSGSARLKAFMEASLRPQWTEQRWRDKLAAGFTNSAGMSGDKLQTLQQLAGFAAQHGMTWVSLGLLPGWQDSLGSPEDTNRLAGFLGLMTQSNSDQGPADAPPNSDRYTGRLFGERIARAAHRWRAGANPTSEAAAIGREEAGADDRIKELRA